MKRKHACLIPTLSYVASYHLTNASDSSPDLKGIVNDDITTTRFESFEMFFSRLFLERAREKSGGGSAVGSSDSLHSHGGDRVLACITA